MTLLQPYPGIAALLGIGQGFQRRRGRGEDNHGAIKPRPEYRQIAGMVARALLLLIGAVMLLIDHDQAEPLIGQE